MPLGKSLFVGLAVLVSTAVGQTKQDKRRNCFSPHNMCMWNRSWSNGTFTDPNLSAEDRQAIADVSNAIQKWGKYKLSMRRSDADFVIAVRVGRVVSTYQGAHVGIHGSPSGGRPTSETGPIAGDQKGPKQDLLWVFAVHPGGTLAGPYWRNGQDHGLAMPELAL